MAMNTTFIDIAYFSLHIKSMTVKSSKKKVKQVVVQYKYYVPRGYSVRKLHLVCEGEVPTNCVLATSAYLAILQAMNSIPCEYWDQELSLLTGVCNFEMESVSGTL